jgi:hypothetical protein
MNRYDIGSTSKFNPLSLQEVMMTPLMQRQKHDQLIAQQEMLRQGLAKVDPLDVHMNEALNVKSQMENKLASQAEKLSKEGINPNTQGDFLALNREYQNLIAPTGRLGQINAAKQVYAKNFNDYLEDATKNKGWSRERALANWNDYSKQYTGFEGNKITNIGQLGAPKKIEVMDVLKDVKNLLGEQVVGEMKASGYNFQPSPDGGMVMVDRSGRRIETSNKPNLQHAQNLINQKLLGKEWQDSIRFEGTNTADTYNQLTSGINSMLSNKVVDNRDENAQYIAPKLDKSKSEDSNMTAYNLGDGQLSDKNQNIMKEIGIGNTKIEGFTKGERDAQSHFNAPLFKVTSQTTPSSRSQDYKKLASSINRTLPANQRFKEGSKEEENAVKNYLTKYGNTVIQNRLVDPFSNETGLLFADKTVGKDAKAAQENLWKRVKIGAAKMVDENGEEIPLNQVQKFTYNGDLTPESNVKVFKGDFRQNYMPHAGTITIGKGDDTEVKKVYISRNSDDFNKPQYKGGVDKNKINNIVTTQPNLYHNFKSSSINAFKNYGMKDVEVKYNENSKTYDVSYKENDGSNIDIKFDNDQNGSAETKFNKWLIKLNE